MDKVTVKIINKSNNPLPQYSTPYSAGMDLRANLEEAVTLQPLERKLIPTGRIRMPNPPKKRAGIETRNQRAQFAGNS